MSQLEIKHPAILETIYKFNETTVIADPAKIVDLGRHLKSTEKFIRLSAITCVDWHPADPRFEIVYHLHSIEKNVRLRVKCRISGENPELDSLCPVWRSANWYEREVFDMFGVTFRNHPNLIRILMPVDWEGHPLRKDYQFPLEYHGIRAQ